jgi:hypothetical protein
MDIIEPLWFTITTVHDLVKANKDIAGEIQELGDTVKLLSLAISPLKDYLTSVDKNNQPVELSEVFGAMRYANGNSFL